MAATRLREQERGRAIAEALQYAEDERVAKRFDNALRLLDAAIAQQGPDEAVTRKRELVLAEKLAVQREQSLAEVRIQARGLRSAGRLSDAIRKIDGALKFLGEDAELSELKLQIEIDEGAQRRAETVREALRQAQSHLYRSETSLAQQVLQTALSKYPGEAKLAELLRAAEARLHDEQRELAIANIVQQARQLASEKRFAEALRSLDDGLKRFPEARPLVKSRESMLEVQARAQSLVQARRLQEQNDFEAALQVLAGAFGGAAAGDPEFLDLKARIESDRDKQRKAQAIREALEDAQVLVQDGRLEDAVASLNAAARRYPNEAQIAALLRSCEENLRRQQRERELASVGDRATALLREGKLEETIALLEGQYGKETRFTKLIARAREELDTKKRDELLLRAGLMRQEGRHQEALDIVTQAIQRYGSTPAAVELEQGVQNAIEEQQRWEARQRNYERLVAIERQIAAESRKRKVKALRGELQLIATAYRTDAEISQLVSRIDAGIESAFVASSAGKRFPWKSLAAGAVVAIAGGMFLVRMPRKSESTLTPSEIRTDPQGAAVQIGERSCTTPNCRFDLPPGQYQVQARLNGYDSVQGTLMVDPERHLGVLNLTLQPVPAPPHPIAPGQAAPQLGTLAVQANAPAALVFIDNVPGGRTDAHGNFSLASEATTHDVRVEKTGYQTAREQRIKLTAGATQKVTFYLVPQQRQVAVGTSIESAPATRSQAPTPPPPVPQPTAPQPPVSINLPQEPPKALPIQELQPRTTPVAPIGPLPSSQPDPETRDWDGIRRTTDPAQLQAFLDRYPKGPHAPEVQALLDDLAWKRTNQSEPESLRAYLNRFPKGAHSGEASSQIAKILDHLEKQRQEADQLNRQRAAILAALDGFNAAFEHRQPRELRQVWPEAAKEYLDAMNQSGASFMMALHPTGEIQITGATASAPCKLITKTTLRGQSKEAEKAVRVVLNYIGGHWLIVNPFGANQ